MIFAAGILIISGDSALFLRRSSGDHVGEWCFPGGCQEDGETLEECALRETLEESGFCPKGDLLPLTRSIAPKEAAGLPAPVVVAEGADSSLTPSAPSDFPSELPTSLAADIASSVEEVDFTTFQTTVDEPFIPVLCEEHSAWCWAKLDCPPEPLHPGVRLALSRLTMDESQIAIAMGDGLLTSPQQYENSFLFAIRITGTGVAYRQSLDEFVFRKPELYLNDAFLKRCNGLFVIWDHPETAILTGKEFRRRIVGAIIHPFIKGDEVWGIARIIEKDVAEAMASGDFSTSPAVNFSNPKVNSRLIISDPGSIDHGSTILIEDKPSLLDHIAICGPGVWDKGGPLDGIPITDSVEPLNAALISSFTDSVRALDVKLTASAVLRKLDSLEKHFA